MVTVVFADLAGFTRLAESRDPEAVKELLDRCFGAMVPVIEEHGGHVDKLIGDELMALFGAPVAHEDDPERAVRAALGLAPVLAQLAPDLVLRVGINTGEVLAGSVGPGRAYTVTGDTVNTAHRLVSAAQPGEVLVGERTWALTATAVEYEDRPPYALRGKQDPVRAWAARRARHRPEHRVARGPLTALIGRTEEMAELRGGVEVAFSQRQPTVITVFGEPGVGKTRLALELVEERWARRGQIRAVWTACPPYGSASGLTPIAEVVRSMLEVGSAQGRGEQVERVERAVRALGRTTDADPDLLSSRVTQLLGLHDLPGRSADADSGPTRARMVDELLWAAHRVLAASSATQPLLVVFDDVQWADDAVLQFLDRVPAAVTDAGLCLVALAREELVERHPELITGGPGLRSLALQGLRRDDTIKLLDELLRAAGPEPEPERTTRSGLDARAESRIIDAAGGNPLLLEQLVRYLVETGALARRHDRWSLAGDFQAVGLPDEVRSLIGARLDALPSEEREFLLDAAIIGRSFWVEAVAALGPHRDPQRWVDALVERGLLAYQQDQAAVGELSFRHALTRDVAYAAVPLAERARKHARVATWLRDRLGGDRAGPGLGLLAHHYERAVMLNRSLEHTDPGLAGAAFTALVRAAHQAERHDALREADEWYRRARQLGSVDRSAALEAVLAHGQVLTELRQLDAAAAAFEEVERDGGPDLTPSVCTALARRGAVARLAGDGVRARESFERALAGFRAAGDRAGEADTVRLQGWSELTVGRVRAALPRLLRAADLERSLGGRARGETLQNLGWCEFQVGSAIDAQRHLWEAGEQLVGAGQLGQAGWCFGILGFTFLHTGRIGQARDIADNLLQLSRAQGDPWAEGRCKLLLAASLVALAELDEAEPLAAEAERTFDSPDTQWERAMVLLVQGRIARARRDLDQGRRLLREGLETSRRATYVGAEARLLVELAGVELDAGDIDAAEHRARSTVSLVRAGLGDDDSQWRAQVILARLARRRGDLAQAQLLLEDVMAYGALNDGDGAGTEPLVAKPIEPTDTWRAGCAELATLLVELGDIESADGVARAAATGVTETARVLAQVALAQSCVLAAQGRTEEARLVLDSLLHRFEGSPLRQVAEAQARRDALA